MKKIFIIILTAILCCFSTSIFTGCTDDDSISTDDVVFERICNHSINAAYTTDARQQFYRDLITDNMYVMLRIDGSLTPYYNDKGEIMKYQEFEKLHINKYHK